MMINCKESSIRSSQLRERQVKGIRKFELWFHLAICKFCRIYNHQIKSLGLFSRKMGDVSCCTDNMTDVCLSEEAKARIKRNLTSA